MEPSVNPEVQELPLGVPRFRRKVETFLESNSLRLEEVDLYLAILGEDGEILAGGGLKGDVIKCVAVSQAARSQGLAAPLVSRLVAEAYQRGVSSVKVFTKPENVSIFDSLGFRVLARAPFAVLMENGRGLEEYCRRLRALRSSAGDGFKVGVIVMNANPFTLGHLHLIREAALQVDRLFVIPVAEEGQRFPYAERFEMIRLGCGSLATVVPGSAYQISAATFPTYFLKDLSDASETQMRLDIDLFCKHIAPALGASVRFAGSEPLDPLTARYNALMGEMLPAAGISFVEVPRLCDGEGPISASRVRAALDGGSYPSGLVPPTTRPYLLADLMARALRLELEAPFKPGLVDPSGSGAHSDMDYALMKGSIDVIRRSFTAHFNPADPVSAGRAAESDLLAFTRGINTYRGAIFCHYLLAYATLLQSQTATSPCDHQHPVSEREMQNPDNQSFSQSSWSKNALGPLPNQLKDSELHFTAEKQDCACGGMRVPAEDIQRRIAELARRVEPQVASHGGKAVAEHGVRGALAMALGGYKELFDDWLPYYRSIKGEEYALQRALLHIMSSLDDTCIIHRAGYDRAQQVKREAAELLKIADQVGNDERVVGNDEKVAAEDAGSLRPNDFGPYEQERGHRLPGTSPFIIKLQQLCSTYAAAGISPGGSADMLSLTLFADSILPNNTTN